MIKWILFSLGLLSAIIALYNYEVYKLFTSNILFLNKEKKQSPKIYTFGNRYKKDDNGNLIVIVEERTALRYYI